MTRFGRRTRAAAAAGVGVLVLLLASGCGAPAGPDVRAALDERSLTDLTGNATHLLGHPVTSAGDVVMTYLPTDYGDHVATLMLAEPATGRLVWSTDTPANYELLGARALDDALVLNACSTTRNGVDVTHECFLTRYDLSGDVTWTWPYETGPGEANVDGATFDVQSGTVLAQYGDTLFAADASTGTASWSLTAPGDLVPNTSTTTAPAVLVYGKRHGSDPTAVTAYDLGTGDELWQDNVGSRDMTTPVLSADSLWYGRDNGLEAFLQGALRTNGWGSWTLSLTSGEHLSEQDFTGTPVAAAGGGYVWHDGDQSAWTDRDGNEQWRKDVTLTYITATGTTLYAHANGQLVVLDTTTGYQLAYLDLPDGVTGENLVAGTGALIYDTGDDTLAVW